MAKVIPTAPFDTRFFAGASSIEVPAKNLFDLVRKIEAQAPGFAAAMREGGLFAVGPHVAGDWSKPLADDAEVLIIPRVAGGGD